MNNTIKKNKIVIFLSVLLILSLTGSIFTFALNFDNTDSIVTSVSNIPTKAHKISKNSDNKTIFRNYNNMEIELDFSHVQSIVNDTRYVYTDNSKVEYWADADGTVVSYNNQSQRDSSLYKANLSKSEIIDSETALKIADLHASSLYGDVIDKYESCNITENDYNYEVIYSVNYGVDGCIYGSECGVVLNHKGVVGVSGMINHEIVKDLDPALLADFTKDKLLDIAEANVRAVYMDKLTSWNLKKTQVVNTDNGYALMFLVTAEFINEDGIALSSTDRYYYVVS